MKMAQFLDIAALLNETFHVAALLYGSLGLECRLGESLNADDIDILIPEKILYDAWDELILAMNRKGYRLYDAHEHAFEKDNVSVAFASLENLGPFAGVDIGRIPVIEQNGVRYLLLELEDYLSVYRASSKDGYRKSVKNKQDQRKIERILGRLG